MPIRDLLLLEFDGEMNKTRTTLERVPEDKQDFVPHAKSMPLARLAAHVAQLPDFGVVVLTTPELDFAKGSFKPVPVRISGAAGQRARRWCRESAGGSTKPSR